MMLTPVQRDIVNLLKDQQGSYLQANHTNNPFYKRTYKLCDSEGFTIRDNIRRCVVDNLIIKEAVIKKEEWEIYHWYELNPNPPANPPSKTTDIRLKRQKLL